MPPMFDILSLLFNVSLFAQSLKKETSQDASTDDGPCAQHIEESKRLKRILSLTVDIHQSKNLLNEFLRNSKDIHEFYQKLFNLSRLSKRKDARVQIMKNINDLLTKLQLAQIEAWISYLENVNVDVEQSNLSFAAYVKNAIKVIKIVVPLLRETLKQLLELVPEFSSNVLDENFQSKGAKDNLSDLDTNAQEGLDCADKLILSSIPILDFVDMEIKRALDEIS